MDTEDESLRKREKHNRLSEYKARSVICDQESRRLQLLFDQKRKREETLNALRKSAQFSDSEDEPEGKREEESENFMEWTESKAKKPRLKDLFMLSEWMVQIPEDLEEKWLFVMCPVGKRCLIRCAKGKTSVYGKKGYQLAKFQCGLPNGSQKDFSGCRYSNSEVTLLDCIWNPQTKTYYILDLLSWKGQLYMETEASFRGFWIKSKLEEAPWLLTRSEKTPFPFVPLDRYPCDSSTLSSVLARHPFFPSNQPPIDGILFFHSEALYTPGQTPLVVWLKAFMVPEVLGIAVSDPYMDDRPATYVHFLDYIEGYEEKQKEKKKKPKRKKDRNRGEEGRSAEVEMQEQF